MDSNTHRDLAPALVYFLTRRFDVCLDDLTQAFAAEVYPKTLEAIRQEAGAVIGDAFLESLRAEIGTVLNAGAENVKPEAAQ